MELALTNNGAMLAAIERGDFKALAAFLRNGALTSTFDVPNGTVRQLGGLSFVSVGTADDVTAVTSNNAFVSFTNSYSIPANTFRKGTVLRANALVRVGDASGVVTLTCQIRLGSTALVTTTAVDPTATTDLHRMSFDIVSRANPSGTSSLVGFGSWSTNTGGTVATGTGLLSPTNFATNGALTLDVQAKWSASNASTSARLEAFNVEVLG